MILRQSQLVKSMCVFGSRLASTKIRAIVRTCTFTVLRLLGARLQVGSVSMSLRRRYKTHGCLQT